MRRWKPQSAFGRWTGLVLLIGFAVASAWALQRLAGQLRGTPETWPVSLALFADLLLVIGLLMLTGALLYRVVAVFTMRYEMDRNGLYILWLGNRAVVPLDQVQTVDAGAAASLPLRVLQGIGYYWGQGRLGDGKPLHLFATQPPDRCLIVHTPQAAYAISPAEPEAFVQDLEQRRNLGATKTLSTTIQPSRIFLYAFWNDRIVRWLLIAAFAFNLLVIGLLAARYPELAPVLPMRIDPAAGVAELRPRHQVLFLPIAAFGLSLLNTALGLLFYQRQRVGARLLQSASVLVQLLFAVAIVMIIS